jgi:putative oxidoreductase
MTYRDLTGPLMQDRLLSVMRIMFGLLFLQHGMAKLLHFPHVAAFDNLAMFQLAWFAGVIELVGGTLITLGLFTRAAAFIASGEMAFAYFISHHPRNPIPLLNAGNLSIAYSFAFLYFSVAGGGAWSLDRWLEQRRASASEAA